jgi:hypothetical protein
MLHLLAEKSAGDWRRPTWPTWSNRFEGDLCGVMSDRGKKRQAPQCKTEGKWTCQYKVFFTAELIYFCSNAQMMCDDSTSTRWMTLNDRNYCPTREALAERSEASVKKVKIAKEKTTEIKKSRLPLPTSNALWYRFYGGLWYRR